MLRLLQMSDNIGWGLVIEKDIWLSYDFSLAAFVLIILLVSIVGFTESSR